MTFQIEFIQLISSADIHKLLNTFDCIFPHLKEKVYSYEEYSKKLSTYALCFECKIDGETAGILIFYANDATTNTAYISLIGVLPQWQGKKIGKKLLDYCILIARDKNMVSLKLEVDNDNISAIKFYQKNGFVFCGNKSNSSIQMIKNIGNSL